MAKQFDFNKIDDFDDHIQQSIPSYETLALSTKMLAEYYYQRGSNIYDLGCSTGKFLNSLETNCNKIGYDNSNLLPFMDGFYNVDLEGGFIVENASVVFSLFTMQFLRKEYRMDYLRTIYDGLNDGGALFIAEKTHP